MTALPAIVSPRIKPIQTVCFGYRFRSRLEARWAVCFEKLGLRWEYEQEGFTLPDQSKYLPDFYLPDQKIHIEIKPAIQNPRIESVYLAGKFDSDWRSSIAPGFGSMDFDDAQYGKILWIDGFHNYAGPFKASLSAHGWTAPSTHGLSGRPDENGDFSVEYPLDEGKVFGRCIVGIRQCTVLFAWIDALDCYGTLAEIGMALALGKRIYLGIRKDLHVPVVGLIERGDHCPFYRSDLWFIERMANQVVRADSALSAYRQTVGCAIQEAQKIQQLPDSLLIAGNPHPGEYQVFGNIYSSLVGNGALCVSPSRPWAKTESPVHIGVGATEDALTIEALAVARSARFEHGESPL